MMLPVDKRLAAALVLAMSSGCRFPVPPEHEADATVDADPADAPTTCTPDTITCGDERTRIECDANGQIAQQTFCALGCTAADGAVRCEDIDPSNGLAAHLDQSPGGPDLVFDSGGTSKNPHTIDTSTGTICNQDGCATPPSAVADGVRVFWVSSLIVQGHTKASGEHALAFVSNGDVTITGVLDVSADLSLEGPGRASEVTCFGGTFTGPQPRGGGGGGGRFHSGGSGGSAGGNLGGSGGAPIGGLTLTPLQGGCRGGRSNAPTPGQVFGRPGGGGGAVQLVSRTQISLLGSGSIDASGGGGGRDAFLDGTPCCAGGGGSGGAVLLEAPQVLLRDTSVISTKGGGGASAGANGADGDGGSAAASGGTGTVDYAAGGSGGTAESTPGHGASLAERPGGGGGGSAGRARFNTSTGAVSVQGQSAIRSPQSAGTVGRREIP